MADTSVVFNVIGKESGVGAVLGRVKGLFKSTGAEGAAAMKMVDHEVEKLDHDIKSAKDSLSVLAREFVKAGTAAERTSISRQMTREKSNLGKLLKVKDLLPDPSDVTSGGKSLGRVLTSGIASGVSSAANAGPLTPAIIGTVLTAAPFIASTLAGAIVGAAGAGGVVGGVLLAVHDARVQAAWTQLAAGAGPQLENAAAPFVPAVQRAIATASHEFDSLVPTIRSVFASSAGYIDPLVKGVAGFVRNFADGFAQAARSAGPVIAAIGDHLPQLGKEIGDLFEMAARHADTGAEALRGLFTIVEFGINLVSGLLEGLIVAYEKGRQVLEWLGIVDKVKPSASAAASGTFDFKKAVDETSDAAKKGTDAISTLKNEMDSFADSNLSVYDALTAAKGAIVDATAAIKKNGEGISVNTKKGRENRDTLSGLAKSFNTVTTANDKANTSANISGAAYDKQRAAFVRAATQAGYTAKAANNLADQVLKVPRSRVTTFQAQTAAAKAGIDRVRAALDRIPRVVQIAMRITGTSNVSAAAAAVRKNEGRAGGGPVNRDQPYMVGEEGPELIIPQTNGTVLTASMTRGVMGRQSAPAARSTGSPVSSSGGQRMLVEVVGSDRGLVELVRRLIRTEALISNAIG
jgi:hypothetical protein